MSQRRAVPDLVLTVLALAGMLGALTVVVESLRSGRFTAEFRVPRR